MEKKNKGVKKIAGNKKNEKIVERKRGIGTWNWLPFFFP